MKKEFSYLGYPILNRGSFYLVYNINNGEIISGKNYKTICDNLGKIKPSNKFRKKSFLGINFCLNSTCNLNCKYCAANANKIPSIINEQVIEALFKKVLNNKLKELKISFTGGEPTLAIDKIKYIIDKLSPYKFKKIYLINTNGIVSKKNLNYLINKHFKFFISLDGPKKINDLQRRRINGKGSYDEVIKTIKYLISKKAEVVLRSTLTKDSIKELPTIIKIAKRLKIKVIRITNVMECGQASINDMRTPSAKEFIEKFHLALKLAKKYNILLVSSQFTNLFSPSIHCCATMAGSEIIVTPEGNLTSCFASYKKNDPHASYFIYGNYDSNKNKFIIDKEKKRFLEKYNVRTNSECKDCFCKYICSGGCPLIHSLFAKNKKFGKINKKYCNYIKEEIKTLLLNEFN